jgi:hypothetical protein
VWFSPKAQTGVGMQQLQVSMALRALRRPTTFEMTMVTMLFLPVRNRPLELRWSSPDIQCLLPFVTRACAKSMHFANRVMVSTLGKQLKIPSEAWSRRDDRSIRLSKRSRQICFIGGRYVLSEARTRRPKGKGKLVVPGVFGLSSWPCQCPVV